MLQRLTLLAFLFTAYSHCQATDTSEVKDHGVTPLQSYVGDITSREYLSGDWAGHRSQLADKGLQTNLLFVPYFQTVTQGGLKETTKNGGKVTYNLTLDLDRLGAIPGGLLTMKTESRYGKTANTIADGGLPVNMEGSTPATRNPEATLPIVITDLNYTHNISDNFSITVGKCDTSIGDTTEFASGRGITQFMNSNLIYSAATTYPPPYSSLSAGFNWTATKNLTVNGTLYGTQEASTTSGFSQLEDGGTWTSEVYYQDKIGSLPYGVMAAFNYSFAGEFPKLDGTLSKSAWSVYFNGWQYLYVADAVDGPLDINKGNSLKGFGLYARLSFSEKKVNPLFFSASAGLGGRGMIPGRPDDNFGIGYFYTSVNNNLAVIVRQSDAKLGGEVFYNIALMKSTYLKFDAQVLDTPLARKKTTVVLGCQLRLTL
jgi:porin